VSIVDDLLDRAVMWIVTRVPGWAVAVVAMILYPCIGLLLPVAFNWSMTQFVIANVLGVSGAAVFGVGWLAARVESAQRRHLLEWTTDLRQLSAEEFEWLVGETFRRDGWKVTERGRQHAPDGNIDLELARDGHRTIVQCKRWSSWEVPVDEIRGFLGTLSIEGGDGIFVTLSNFTPAAIEEAGKGRLKLVNGRELYAMIEKARRAEPCPVCGRPMRLDHSVHGWWFRCIAPGCPGKRNLGPDAGRAIEFLTEAR